MASKKDKFLESAQRFLLKGQLDRAIKDYQQVVALDPREVRYRQKLAELLVRDNRKEEAIAQYEDIGKHYAENSYYLKAIAVYKQIQRLSPDNIAISLTLGSLNHKQGLSGNALAEYGQVVARYEKEGNLKEAVKVLEKMLEVDAAHVPTRLKYAEALFALGSRDASYQAFSSLLAAVRAGGDAAVARDVSARMGKLFPEEQENDLDLLAQKMSAGDPDAAIATLRERLKRDGANLQAWQLLCDALRAKGDQTGLRSAYDQMAQLFSADPAVLEGSIRCDLEAGDFQRALAQLELHLPRFLEKKALQPAEDLYLSLPADVAADPRVDDALRRIYEAAGALDKLNALKSKQAQSQQAVSEPEGSRAATAAEAPSWSGPAAEFPEPPEPPSAFGAPWAPEAPSAAVAAVAVPKTEASEPASPWEEEIELDLDDDLYETVLAATPEVDLQEVAPAAVPEVDISLDFSTALNFDEPDLSAAAASGQEQQSLSDFSEESPFGEPSASGETASWAEESAAESGDDTFAAAGEEQEGTSAQDWDEGFPLELALPDEAEGAEPELAEPELEFAELELVESELTEPELAEEIEELELPEAADFLAAPEVPEVPEVPEAQPTPGWETIYPDPEAADSVLDLEELESHYDLGIGYKEMGLYNAAIKEFSVAATNPLRRLDCLTLQAICYREKGEPDKAQDLLQRGRALKVLSAEERMSLSYELAFLLESTGAVEEAIGLYREVLKVNPHFGDVAQKVSALTGDDPLDVIELDLEECEN